MSLPIKPILKPGIGFSKSIEFTRLPVVTNVEPPPADGLLLPGVNAKLDPERVKSISNTFTVGYADRIGFRDSMEDKIVICGNFRNNPEEDYYAIFDGHAGKDASAFCSDYLHKVLEDRLKENEKDVSNCLIQTFKQTHELMKNHKTPEGNFVESGTTSLVAFFKENELYVANAGDSRAVFCKNKISMCITEDHKPDLEREYKRICSIPGGFVQKSRVQGKLAVARAIGDFKWNPYVSEIPDVYGPFNWKDPQYEFLILACDGLWDVMDEKKACDFVRKCKDPREAAIKLRDWAYNERSKDNLSVIVIWFPGFKPDYEPPPVVQLLQTRNNNAQSNDGKSETSDNSGDSDSESSCEGDDDSSSNYDDESEEDSESDESNDNTTKEQQLHEETSSKKQQNLPPVAEKVEKGLSGGNGLNHTIKTLNFTINTKQQNLPPVVEKVDEGLSGGNGLNCTIKTLQVEKVVEEEKSAGGNLTQNLTIKQPVVEKVVEQEDLSPVSPGVNTTLNFTIKSKQPVVEKVVEQDLSSGGNTTSNFTIKIKQPVVEKAVEQDLSLGGNTTSNFTIKIKQPVVEQDLSPGGNTTSNFTIKSKQPVVEQDLSPGGNTTLNFTINTKQQQNLPPVVEKVDEGLSGGNGLNCTIKTLQVEKVVEEDLSSGNGTLNFSIKSKLKIPSM